MQDRQNNPSGNLLPSIEPLLTNLNGQDWPVSCLYVVATPIGNLADLSLRALYTLALADVIACEDTRSSQVLLNAYGLHKPLLAAHRHNEAEIAEKINDRLEQGQRVVLVSDAGAPAVSDPGGKIVNKVRQAGFKVRPIPGASAVITALMASGLTSDENPAFTFAGFAPSKASARQKWLKQLAVLPMAVLFFESPYRVHACAQDIAAVCSAQRRVMVARELSKRFEQVEIVLAGELMDWFEADPQRSKGEFVFGLEVAPALEPTNIVLDTLLEQLLVHKVSIRDSTKIATKTLGLSRDEVYAKVLKIQAQQ